MAQASQNNWLDRPVDSSIDHALGEDNAEITLVEYGSYDCSHCRAANERITQVRDQLGDRLRYVFRHRPVTGSDIARRAAELAEHARDEKHFWEAHVALMSRSKKLTEEDLESVARELGLQYEAPEEAEQGNIRAKARVESDIASAKASGVMFTPSFFINGRRYDGPWDESSFSDAMLGRLGHRFHAAALTFTFAVTPALVLALILKDQKGVAAFTLPAALITAGAALMGAWPLDIWVALAIVAAAIGIVVISALQHAPRPAPRTDLALR